MCYQQAFPIIFFLFHINLVTFSTLMYSLSTLLNNSCIAVMWQEHRSVYSTYYIFMTDPSTCFRCIKSKINTKFEIECNLINIALQHVIVVWLFCYILLSLTVLISLFMQTHTATHFITSMHFVKINYFATLLLSNKMMQLWGSKYFKVIQHHNSFLKKHKIIIILI